MGWDTILPTTDAVFRPRKQSMWLSANSSPLGSCLLSPIPRQPPFMHHMFSEHVRVPPTDGETGGTKPRQSLLAWSFHSAWGAVTENQQPQTKKTIYNYGKWYNNSNSSNDRHGGCSGWCCLFGARHHSNSRTRICFLHPHHNPTK